MMSVLRALVVATALAPLPLALGQEGGGSSPITLTSVSAEQKDGQWVLSVAGSATKVPAGSILDFELRIRMTTLASFPLTLSSSKRIREAVTLTGLDGYAQRAYLRIFLRFEKQPPEVQKELEADAELFPMERNPWVYTFANQRFDLGTEADLAKQAAANREFFKTSVLELARLDSQFNDTLGAVKNKEQFYEGDKLDAESWQKWLEKEIRDPIRAIQKEIRDSKRKLAFIEQQRDIRYLEEISACVAKRTCERSRQLYEGLGIAPDPNDTAPRDLDVNARSTKGSFLRERVQQLCESQGIEL